MKRILLIAGHGGPKGKYDPGAVQNGTTEHKEMQTAVAKTADILRGAGLQVDTITSDYTLTGKIAYINKHNHDFVIEFHMDSATPSATGATMFYYGGSNWAKGEAQKIIDIYCKNLGIKNRGAKPDTSTRHKRLGIIRDTVPFTLLIETGFISNINDLSLVRKNAANALAASIISYYNIPMNQLFKDVNESHPYYEFAKWAKENGIMTGYNDGRLGIDEQLTVGRLLAILFKYTQFILKQIKG